MKTIRPSALTSVVASFSAATALLLTLPTQAAETEHEHAHPVRAEQLGDVHFPISCDANVQKMFDRALALAHSYSFRAAGEGFAAILKKDPQCAMAYWGLALRGMGSLYEGNQGLDRIKAGREAIGKAKALGAKTPRENDYIGAMEAFFRDDRASASVRVQAFAEAMGKVHRKYPGDQEAEIFYAYAISASGDPKDRTYAMELKAAAILEKVLKVRPNHPGILHYLIHCYDHTPIAAKGLAVAQRYASVAPDAPHALHISSHIFVRTGRWEESIKSNAAGSAPEIDNFFRLHALDFLAYSYLQTGQDAAAKRALDDISLVDGLSVRHLIVAYALTALPARYAIERRRWDEAARLKVRDGHISEHFPQAEAALVFARALGAARRDQFDIARKELGRLAELRANSQKEAEAGGTWGEYWVTQIAVNQEMVESWIAFRQGRQEEALRRLNAAADREDATEKDPVVPGSILSARELLGELLIELKQPAQALRAFEAALKMEPSRFWTLYGAARAAELAGDPAKAKAYYARLVSQTAQSERSELKTVRAILVTH